VGEGGEETGTRGLTQSPCSTPSGAPSRCRASAQPCASPPTSLPLPRTAPASAALHWHTPQGPVTSIGNTICHWLWKNRPGCTATAVCLWLCRGFLTA